MSVQWSGPAADAALASFNASKASPGRSPSAAAGWNSPEASQRSGWDRQGGWARRSAQGDASGRIFGGGAGSVSSLLGPLHTLTLVLLPSIIFGLTTCLFLFSYEDLPYVVWTLIGICALGSLCLTFAGSATFPGTLLGLGVWCCASLVLAIALGHSLYSDTLGPYRQLQEGYNFSDIDPSIPLPREYAEVEAAVVNFTADTFVDDLRTVGFINDGSIYCVAPVARHGVPTDDIVFWAVGIDCCEIRGNFDCGSSRTLGSTTAISYTSESDPLFRRAIKAAGSIYGTTNSSKYPRLVRFVHDPEKVEAFWLRETMGIAVFAFLVHLVWTVLLVLGVDRLAATASAALGARKGGASAAALLPIPVQQEENKRLVFDASNDPFLRGGGTRTREGQSPHGGQSPLSQDSGSTWMNHEEENYFEMNKEHPNFFTTVSIAKDGGFSEVEDFYRKQSFGDWVTAAITPCFILYNMIFILSTDIEFLFLPKPVLDNMYLISTSVLVEPIANYIARLSGNPDSEIHIRAQQTFAILEISGLCYYFFYLLYSITKLSWLPQWLKWHTVYEIYWEMLPRLSTYSLMNFLEPICPMVLLANFEEEVASAARDSVISAREWGMLVKFFLRRAVYAVIGFDAFLVKFRISARNIFSENIGAWEVLGAANFVMQLVGVVKMGNLVQRRLFIFMFAGEDCVMEPKDEVSMRTYNALLAWKIWQSSKSWFHYSVIMLNFSDYDFQKLVLNARSGSSTEGTHANTSEVSLPEPASTFRWPWRSPTRDGGQTPAATASRAGAAGSTGGAGSAA